MSGFRGATHFTKAAGKKGRPKKEKPIDPVPIPTPTDLESPSARTSESPSPILAPVPESERIQRGGYTEAEDEVHTAYVLRLRLRGYSLTDIATGCRETYGFGLTRTKNLLKKGLEKLKGDVDELKPFTKAEQITRLRRLIPILHSEKRYTNMMEVESLLADLEGNKEAQQVDVNVTVGNAATRVLLEMSPEQRNVLLQQALERRRLASLASNLPVLMEPIVEEREAS